MKKTMHSHNNINEEKENLYYENNMLTKPKWLEDDIFKALLDYSSMDDIDNKDKKILLLLKIYRNNHFNLYDYDLMKEIINDFNKIYFDLAILKLREKGLYNTDEPPFLYDMPTLLCRAKEPFLEYIYTKVLLWEETSLVESIGKYIQYYAEIKEYIKNSAGWKNKD